MTKKITKLIGYIQCPFCLSESEVRQTKGRDYSFIVCPVDKSLTFMGYGKAQGYQDYIADKMKPIIEGEYTKEITEPKPDKSEVEFNLPEFNKVTAGSDAVIPEIDLDKTESIEIKITEPALDCDAPFWPWEK